MRVTQSMLANNLLRNLNNSYNKMSSLQTQIDSGSIINRPSDDPVVAIKSIAHKRSLEKNQQFQRNMNTVTKWVDSTDSTLDQTGESIKRTQEIVTQLANDTNTAEDRSKLVIELKQIQEHLRDLANTQVEGQYLFSGTNTQSPLFKKDGTMDTSLPGLDEAINIEVYDGITLKVNSNGKEMFGKIDDVMTKIIDTVNDVGNDPERSEEIGNLLGLINNEGNADSLTSVVLSERARVGAIQNRVEIMQNRLEISDLMTQTQIRDNEDTDYSKAITDLVTQEAIHQASLSIGARIVQPTLVDFMR